MKNLRLIHKVARCLRLPSPFLALLIILAAPVASYGFERLEVDDVRVVACDAYSEDACKGVKKAIDKLSMSKWWKVPATDAMGDGFRARAQFYAQNQNSTTGTLYLTLEIDGKSYTSSHKMKKSANFASAKWIFDE